MNQNLKTAIVHDWLVSYAGSERVVESFTNIWQDADIFTLVDFLNEEERKIILKGKYANTSFIQHLPKARKRHRNYLALFPTAIEKFNLSKYDLVISSSHAVAKGVITNSNQLHICYCHTPIRYAWDLKEQYLKETNLEKGLKGWAANKILEYIKKWDLKTSRRPNYFIANSKFIAERIKRLYNREADVIYPPVDVNKFEVETEKDNYYLTASRMVPYKKIDLIVEAFTGMPDKKLVVIGHGPEMKKIKNKAAANIEIIGYQPFESLKKYMQKTKAFIFAAEEDFGIIAVEAMACGTPVIAFKKGGITESAIEGETGIFFNEQTKDSIIEAVNRFEMIRKNFDAECIRRQSEKFSRKKFEESIYSFVTEKLKEFYK